MPELQLTRAAKRLSARLHLALDGCAYPVNLIDRGKRLATALKVDFVISNSLLSGDTLPDFTILFKLCEITDKQPGFFLDNTAPTSETSGVRTVRSVTTGGDMAVRFPSALRFDEGLDSQLWYYQARQDMELGVRDGDFLITTCHEAGKPTIITNRSYLIGLDGAFHLLTCTEVGNKRAVLKYEQEDHHATIVPLRNGEPVWSPEGIHHFGLLVACLRGHQELMPFSTVLSIN